MSDDALAPIVYIIEDDDEHRRALSELMESAGLTVESCSKPSESFELIDKDRPGCVILDIRLPEVSGLSLIDRYAPLPIVVVTGFGDVQVAVRCLKKGVAEFLEKPVHHQLMIDTVQRLTQISVEKCHADRIARQLRARVASLSQRQVQVISQALLGASNKEIGVNIGLSPRTIEKHKQAAREKLGDLTEFPLSLVLKELSLLLGEEPVASPTSMGRFTH
ncbi:MAG: response regulator [Alphaproteobacteria bacterium]|nr:response regulator [Alphaproteobacteria bacterium]